MNQTQLDLLFIDSPNEKVIYLQDVSEYNPDLEILSPLLQITPPNFSTRYNLVYPPNHTIYINSNALGWSNTTNFKAMPILADGLWKITQSVYPNDCLYKDHYHFRIVNLKKKIMCHVHSNFQSPDYCFNSDDVWAKDLFILLQLLESAKYMAENCNKHKEAVIIYNKVEEQFKKYQCETC